MLIIAQGGPPFDGWHMRVQIKITTFDGHSTVCLWHSFFQVQIYCNYCRVRAGVSLLSIFSVLIENGGIFLSDHDIIGAVLSRSFLRWKQIVWFRFTGSSSNFYNYSLISREHVTNRKSDILFLHYFRQLYNQSLQLFSTRFWYYLQPRADKGVQSKNLIKKNFNITKKKAH